MPDAGKSEPPLTFSASCATGSTKVAAVRLQLVTRSLISRGYRPPAQAEPIPAHSAELRTALSRFQADNGMVVTGVVDFPTYEREAVQLRGALARRHAGPHWLEHHQRRTSHRAHPAEAVLPPRGSKPAAGCMGPAPPSAASICKSKRDADRTAFEVGEQIFLSATVSRASYLQCYLADATGTG